MNSPKSGAHLLRQVGAVAKSAAPSGARSLAVWAGTVAAALGSVAYVNHNLAKRAEHDHPPAGRFVEVDGVRLHYVERGSGDPLVLLHGISMSTADFETSGLIELAAEHYRVIAFDRPGFGHSDRPRDTIWTDVAQADLIHAALAQIGVSRATVLGHSWGCSVAVALALRHPDSVAALVLESGYYYPSPRVDVALMSGPVIPVVGDIMRYTLSPILARLMWPRMTRKMFGPAPVPAKFNDFPREFVFRPSQIRASAAESALMIPDAFAREGRYAELRMPVVIVAGEEDLVIDIDDQSARLHAELPGSSFERVPGVGHMVHQTAPDRVMAAIRAATGDPSARPRALAA